MLSTRYSSLVIVLISLLSACGEDSKTKTQAAVVDPLTPRYESSLAEGVDFKKPGYPNFLAEVSGMATQEAWGRWTNATVAKFRFKQKLPNKFTLLISAGAIGPNVGKPIIVRAGNVTREFIVNIPGPIEFSLNFEGVDGADTIEIVPPNPVRPKDIDPKSDDERTLGISMINLKVK